MMGKWLIAFSVRIRNGFVVEARSLFLWVEIFTEGATGEIRHTYIISVGKRLQLLFHRGRNPQASSVIRLDFRNVWPAEEPNIVSRTHLIAVVVISKVFDVFQPLTHFIVSVGLSHSTARRVSIEARVSDKERTGCSIRKLRMSARYNPAAPNDSGKTGIVPAAISYHYTIVAAHGDSSAVVVVGRVIRNH
jgi:hypothetical protein